MLTNVVTIIEVYVCTIEQVTSARWNRVLLFCSRPLVPNVGDMKSLLSNRAHLDVAFVPKRKLHRSASSSIILWICRNVPTTGGFYDRRQCHLGRRQHRWCMDSFSTTMHGCRNAPKWCLLLPVGEVYDRHLPSTWQVAKG